MSTVLLIVVIAAFIGLGALYYWSKRRSENLRQHFGTEYDRTVEEFGDRRRAESALTDRQRRVERLNIHSLPESERDRFAEAWRQAQTRFVDDPKAAVADADRLCIEVMRARGYPMAEFEQRAEDVSVDHPAVVDNYRAAHRIAESDQRGDGSTEDLRRAMVHYRSLFDDLLEFHTSPRQSLKN